MRVAHADVRSGLKLMRQTQVQSFRASAWAAVVLKAENAGEKPWTPGSAKLTCMTTGMPVTVVSVSMKHPQLASGESALVVVETLPPPTEAGELFTLELFGADGARGLSLSGVQVHTLEGQKP